MLRLILVSVLSLVFVVGQAQAQTAYSWATAANGDWNVGGNWNPAAIPGALDSALINATGPNYTVTLSDAQSINNLTIDSANATFRQTGALTLGGTLTLNSGIYQVASLGSPGIRGINGGQIVSTGGMRLTGDGVLNNVTLGNAANPDVLAIDNLSRNWWFYGSTDFQPGFVPTVGTNGVLLFGSLTIGTNKMLNTGFNLNGGTLRSENIASAVTLKSGNVITATGADNVIGGAGNWNINGTVKTNDSGSTNLQISGATPSRVTIGSTGSVIAGSSSGTALIYFQTAGAAALIVEGTIRANSGGTINIVGENFFGGPQVFAAGSQLIADGGTIIIRGSNFNIAGTLTMMNGGIISMPIGTTNYTNTGVLSVETTSPTAPSKMEVGSTPESTLQNPGTINISIGSEIIVGGGGGTVNSGGTIVIDGTLSGGLSLPSGGTASGSGTITGPTIALPGSILLPGNSPGKMTLQNGLTLGGQYGWELASNTETGPGINFDQILVTAGNVMINPSASLNLTLPTGGTSNPFWASNHSWLILDNSGAGTTSGLFDPSQIIGGIQPNGAFSTSLVGNDLFLNWTFSSVPEPGTLLLVGLAGMGTVVASWKRRRRRLLVSAQQSHGAETQSA